MFVYLTSRLVCWLYSVNPDHNARVLMAAMCAVEIIMVDSVGLVGLIRWIYYQITRQKHHQACEWWRYLK